MITFRAVNVANLNFWANSCGPLQPVSSTYGYGLNSLSNNPSSKPPIKCLANGFAVGKPSVPLAGEMTPEEMEPRLSGHAAGKMLAQTEMTEGRLNGVECSVPK